MFGKYREIIIWICILLFPMSHFIQIYKILNVNTVKDFSLLTFALFFIGNLFGFIYSKGLFDFRSWVGYLVCAILEVYIVYLVLQKENKPKKREKLNILIIISLFFIVLTFYFLVYPNSHVDKISGIVPALIFPLATLIELFDIWRLNHLKSNHDSTIISWIFILIGNIGLYLLAGEIDGFTDWKPILAYLVSGGITIIIIAKIIQLKLVKL